MDFSNKNRPSESGSALLIVVAISVFVMLTIAGVVLITNNRQRETKLDDLRGARDEVLKQVTSKVTLPSAMRFSALRAENVALRRCVGITPPALGGACTATSPANQQAFNLYVPHSAGAAGYSIVAGTATPAYYTSRGLKQACAAGPLCPYMAQVYFWATGCGPTGCQKIFVRPIVRVRPGVTFPSGLRLEARPQAADFAGNPAKYAFEMLASDIRGATMQECSSGSFLTGLTDTGAITCKCMPGFTETGRNALLDIPICTPTLCDKSTVFIGFDANNSPKCEKLDELRYDCTPYNVPNNGVVRCPAKSKLRQAFSNGDCFLEPAANVPGCPKTKCVKCPTMLLSCCKVK